MPLRKGRRPRCGGRFGGGAITSDAGALLLGAADRAVGLLDRFAACFRDGRAEDLIEHTTRTLVGQRVVGIALGYEDLVDHDHLRHDPVMAVLTGKPTARRKACAPLAGKSTLSRLEHAPQEGPALAMRICSAGKEASLNVKGRYLEVRGDTLGCLGVGPTCVLRDYRLDVGRPNRGHRHGPLGAAPDVDIAQGNDEWFAGRRAGGDRSGKGCCRIGEPCRAWLHAWALTSDSPSLSARLVLESGVNADIVRANAQAVLERAFDITHVTLAAGTFGLPYVASYARPALKAKQRDGPR